MNDDLIRRLRDPNARFMFQGGSEYAVGIADRIERLQGDNENLRKLTDRSAVVIVNKLLIERAEKAEAELARLTPTEEEKLAMTEFLAKANVTGISNRSHALVATLLRKFVLREPT